MLISARVATVLRGPSEHRELHRQTNNRRLLLSGCALVSISCNVAAGNEEFFGKTTPPERNILRYVNGGEPESFDPAISSGQPEARIYMALFEGLVEYHPKSLDAIPAIAESWDTNNDSSEFVFRLRRNARWSNGDPITAHDLFTACAAHCLRKSNRALQISPTTSRTPRHSIPSQYLSVTPKQDNSC